MAFALLEKLDSIGIMRLDIKFKTNIKINAIIIFDA